MKQIISTLSLMNQTAPARFLNATNNKLPQASQEPRFSNAFNKITVEYTGPKLFSETRRGFHDFLFQMLFGENSIPLSIERCANVTGLGPYLSWGSL